MIRKLLIGLDEAPSKTKKTPMSLILFIKIIVAHHFTSWYVVPLVNNHVDVE